MILFQPTLSPVGQMLAGYSSETPICPTSSALETPSDLPHPTCLAQQQWAIADRAAEDGPTYNAYQQKHQTSHKGHTEARSQDLPFLADRQKSRSHPPPTNSRHGLATTENQTLISKWFCASTGCLLHKTLLSNQEAQLICQIERKNMETQTK